MRWRVFVSETDSSDMKSLGSRPNGGSIGNARYTNLDTEKGTPISLWMNLRHK